MSVTMTTENTMILDRFGVVGQKSDAISRDELIARLDAAEKRIQGGEFITESEMWAHERSKRAQLLGK